MNGDTADLSQRLAQAGHEIMLERLRAAFANQLSVRAAGLEIETDRVEQLVQGAAARAGAALWRRSLAEAAVRELGIGLAEAIDHPAVDAAQQLAGAPPYRGPGDRPAEAIELDPAPAVPEPVAEAVLPEPDPGPEPDPEPEPEPADAGAGVQDEGATAGLDPVADRVARHGTPPSADPATAQALRLAAVHVTGIETLRPGDRDIELRLSQAGLDVLKRSSGTAIGRLDWGEIETIELPPPRRGLRGRRRGRELVVSTGRGQAQFELSGLTDEDLREHVEPMLARLHGRSAAAE